MNSILVERPAIQEKALLIADMVARSLEMSLFKQAERDLQEDQQAQALLADMQQKQSRGEEVEDLLDRLEQLTVVRRFTIAQEGLSELMAHTTKILAATLSDRLDLVTEQTGCSGCSCAPGGCEGFSAGCAV